MSITKYLTTTRQSLTPEWRGKVNIVIYWDL